MTITTKRGKTATVPVKRDTLTYTLASFRRRSNTFVISDAVVYRFAIGGEWEGVAAELVTRGSDGGPRFATIMTKGAAFDLPKGTISATVRLIGHAPGVSLTATVEPLPPGKATPLAADALPMMQHEMFRRMNDRNLARIR